MRPGETEHYQQLESELLSFDERRQRLPGIHDPAKRESLLEQLLESIRRVKFVSVIRTRDVSGRRADPSEEIMFDPVRAAVLCDHQGRIDEAFWFVFLFVHFGRNFRTGWNYAREVYGRLGSAARWDWVNTSSDPSGFREWLDAHQEELKRNGGFGNHRKYQSLDAYSPTGTGAAIESYVRWVDLPRTHADMMSQARQRAGGNPRMAFDLLYHSMSAVTSFGRTARFDYLCMVSKLGLAPIEPGSTYIKNSTGPIDGARLLFGNSKTAALSPSELDEWLVDLEAHLDVGMVGMQVVEDALCNWQKSPTSFKPFRR